MTRKKQPSLLDGDKSLTVEQIANCYELFLDSFEELKKLPQVTLESVKNRMVIKFNRKSDSYVVVTPKVIIEDVEACAGFEKYKTVQLTAEDCGLCKGTKTIAFDNKVLHKFNVSLGIAVKLFQEAYLKALQLDKEQIQWERKVRDVRIIMGVNKKRTNPDSSYEEGFIWRIKGNLNDSDNDKTFDLRLEDLTNEQAERLGRFLKTL